MARGLRQPGRDAQLFALGAVWLTGPPIRPVSPPPVRPSTPQALESLGSLKSRLVTLSVRRRPHQALAPELLANRTGGQEGEAVAFGIRIYRERPETARHPKPGALALRDFLATSR